MPCGYPAGAHAWPKDREVNGEARCDCGQFLFRHHTGDLKYQYEQIPVEKPTPPRAC